jgi:hypothetical protein
MRILGANSNLRLRVLMLGSDASYLLLKTAEGLRIFFATFRRGNRGCD